MIEVAADRYGVVARGVELCGLGDEVFGCIVRSGVEIIQNTAEVGRSDGALKRLHDAKREFVAVLFGKIDSLVERASERQKRALLSRIWESEWRCGSCWGCRQCGCGRS